PAAIVRNRRDVLDGGDLKSDRLQRAQRRLAAATGTLHEHLDSAHAVILGLLAGILGRDLGGIGRRLARALEAPVPGRRPRDRVALGVGDRDDRVVERRVDVRDARRDVLALLAPRGGPALACHALGSPYFFLPAIGRAGPFRVRAFVWVRWPRTGSPRR